MQTCFRWRIGRNLDTFAITLPIFALIALGWGGTRAGLFTAETGAGLSAFVFWLAFPALLLSSMARAPAPDAAMAGHIGLYAAVLLAALAVCWLTGRALGFDPAARAGAALAASCGNTAFLGTAIITGVLGSQALPLAAALVAAENVAIVGLAVAGLRLSAGGQLKTAAVQIVKGLANPVSIGALAGLSLSLSGAGLHDALARPLSMLGAAASPAGLVGLGIVMASRAPGQGVAGNGAVALAVVMKCALVPAMMAAVFTVAGAPLSVVATATILAACPSAVNVFVQARQAGIWADQAALAVFVSTLVSVVGVSVAAAMFAG